MQLVVTEEQNREIGDDVRTTFAVGSLEVQEQPKPGQIGRESELVGLIDRVAELQEEVFNPNPSLSRTLILSVTV